MVILVQKVDDLVFTECVPVTQLYMSVLPTHPEISPLCSLQDLRRGQRDRLSAVVATDRSLAVVVVAYDDLVGKVGVTASTLRQ